MSLLFRTYTRRIRRQTFRVYETLKVWTFIRTEQPAGVRMAPPQRETAALAQAHSLATTVRTEVADLLSAQTFDELMQERRGRTWLP
jgi:hypothetical protein